MRKTLATITTVISLFFVSSASAHAIVGVTYGADVTVISPQSFGGEGGGMGIGVMGRLEVDLPGPLTVTGRVGYSHHLEKASTKMSLIPMLVGVKFGLGVPGIGLYTYLECGFVRMSLGPAVGSFSLTNTEAPPVATGTATAEASGSGPA